MNDCNSLHTGWQKENGTAYRNKPLVNILIIADCIDAATDNIGRLYGLGKTLEDLIQEFDESKDVRYSGYISGLFHEEEIRRKINYVIGDRRKEIYCDIYFHAQ